MNKQEFLHIITHPSDISPKEAEALEEMTVNFPYCQLAHVLLAKNAHDKNNMMALQRLKTAAVYSASRTALKNLIYSENQWHSSPSRVLESMFALVPENNEEAAAEPMPLPYTEPNDSFTPLSLEQEISEVASKWSSNIAENEPVVPVANTTEAVPETNKPVENSVINELKATIEELQRTKRELAAQKQQNEQAHQEQETPTPSTDDTAGKGVAFSEKPDRKAQIELIDKFIVSNPRMPQANDMVQSGSSLGDLASDSSRIDETLVSENFAVILTRQGKINKAIEIYRKLILKYPEKSSYFASRIESLEKMD
ncbi:hypothetical protein SAMN05421780_106187 [Flexibacter flexilis DSM 6793]|uniref:Tetratricopeptide repeat-containing protein n=1 Tax=Flexibacter flexilis DSM 6793 TaxID=927664 RepID=A0A1I1K8Z5_9BACT|nr:hypothetical protein [Flexibacter flexilis]SFC54010.1 hypothetical protein SAMN05421780_106187 [Flexibacter flexilis DSM 6793]